MTLAVNFRHLFYGLSFTERFRQMGKKRWYMIYALTDETYSLLCSQRAPEGVEQGQFFFAIALLDELYWIAGAVLGTVVGGLLPFDTTGIDFAMTALFIVIAVEQWQAYKSRFPALWGAGCALACLARRRSQARLRREGTAVSGTVRSVRHHIFVTWNTPVPLCNCAPGRNLRPGARWCG